MTLNLKNVNLNGIAFQISTLPLMTRVRLDLRVARLLAPVLGSIGISGSADIKDILQADLKLDGIAEGIGRALEAIPEAELLQLMRDCLTCVTATAPGAAPTLLTSDRDCEEVFASDHFVMYQLLLEVLKHNKIVPFGLRSIGM